MPESAARARTLLLIGAFATIYLGWGTTYLANHFLLLEVPPFVIGSLRFSFAGLLALAWVILSGQLRIQRSDWGGGIAGRSEPDRSRPGRTDLRQPVFANRHAGDALHHPAVVERGTGVAAR